MPRYCRITLYKAIWSRFSMQFRFMSNSGFERGGGWVFGRGGSGRGVGRQMQTRTLRRWWQLTGVGGGGLMWRWSLLELDWEEETTAAGKSSHTMYSAVLPTYDHGLCSSSPLCIQILNPLFLYTAVLLHLHFLTGKSWLMRNSFLTTCIKCPCFTGLES